MCHRDTPRRPGETQRTFETSSFLFVAYYVFSFAGTIETGLLIYAMKNCCYIIILLAFFLIPEIAYPQKTALVLSGGGAKGFSHIGVLQALEENNIPIDYIVGNSMGALVGGLYAAGYSPEQIKKILTNPDLFNFKRSVSKTEYFFFQKFQDDASWITIPFAIRKGLKPLLPFNFYDIQNLDYQLMEVFAGASAEARYNFDSLFVPFRCVATDIDSSRLIILGKGDLAKAVRASFTFPFFIRPIKVNKKLLFDGGIIDNFPVNVAVSTFHPDFIIGSKAVSNYNPPEADDVVSQLQNMLMKKADFTIDPEHGLVIETRTGDENIFQFKKIDQFIDSGYRAALRVIPELKKRIAKQQDTESLAEKRKKFIEKKPPLVIGKVDVQGVNIRQRHYFLKSIRISNDTIVSQKFQKQYKRLLANENVKTVYPSLCYDKESGKYDITLNIKVANPFNIRFGGYISSSAVNEAFLRIDYHHLGKTSKYFELNSYFGTFYNSLFALAKYEQQGKVPFSIMLDFLVSRKNYFTNSRYFFEDKSPSFIIADENYLDLNFALPVGLSHVVRIGASNLNLNYLYYQDNYFTRTDTADQSSFYFINPYIELERNSLNRKQFPTKGSYFFMGFSYFTGNEHTIPGTTLSGNEEFRRDLDFFLVSLHYEQYLNISKPFRMGLSASFEYSNKPLLNNYVSSLLISSSYEPVLMMKTMFLESYRTYTYGTVGVKILFNFLKNFEVRLEGNYFVPYQKILRGEDGYSAQFSKPFTYHYLAATGQLIYQTPLGPIGLAVNYFEKDGSKVTALFTIGYLIFNKSRFYR